MWRSVLIFVSILLMLGSNIRSANADDGEWVPPPERSDDPANTYIAVGVTVFGLAYIPSLTVGTISMLDNTVNHVFHGETSAALGWHVIPAWGPFVYAIQGSRDTAWEVEREREINAARGLSVASGLVQMTGLVLLTYGITTSKHRARTPQPRAPRFIPTATRDGVGTSLSMDL